MLRDMAGKKKMFAIVTRSHRQRALYEAGAYNGPLRMFRAALERAGIEHALPAKFPKEK